MSGQDLTSKMIFLKSDKGTLFTGKVSHTNSGLLETWEYLSSSGSGKICACYVSEPGLKSVQESYIKCMSENNDRKCDSYKRKLVNLVSFEANKYNGDTGFVVQLVQKPEGYRIVAHKVSRYSEGKGPDLEDMAFELVSEGDATPAKKTPAAKPVSSATTNNTLGKNGSSNFKPKAPQSSSNSTGDVADRALRKKLSEKK